MKEKTRREKKYGHMFSPVKIWHLGLSQPQKLTHKGRIAQVHLSKPPVQSQPMRGFDPP